MFQRIFKISKLINSILIIMAINGCISVPSKSIPKADIVYESLTNGETKIEPRIGFVNEDGSGNIILETELDFNKPACLDGGKIIYFLMWNGRGSDRGYLSYWKENQRIHRCRKWESAETFGGIIPNTESRQAVINYGSGQILIVDIQRCENVEILVDLHEDNSRRVYGASLSTDGKKLLYSQESDRFSGNPKYSILVIDMDSREVNEIGSGIYPVWSPDGKKITYIQLDGIYVMNADGGQNQKIIDLDLRSSHSQGEFGVLLPYPRWSPDGKYLIYHRCPEFGLNCHLMKNTIFKIDIMTKEEIKILEGGSYPYWCLD